MITPENLLTHELIGLESMVMKSNNDQINGISGKVVDETKSMLFLNTMNGIKKLPKPPIKAGITIKNIIKIAWAVIILLYNWLSAIYWTPGPLSSILIRTENAVPNKPEKSANIKYQVPMSFAFVDANHLSLYKESEEVKEEDIIFSFFVVSLI